MTTLYIDRKGAEIDVEGDTVVVRTDGERRGTIPLKPLERVVVASSARLTTRCLARSPRTARRACNLRGLCRRRRGRDRQVARAGDPDGRAFYLAIVRAGYAPANHGGWQSCGHSI